MALLDMLTIPQGGSLNPPAPAVPIAPAPATSLPQPMAVPQAATPVSVAQGAGPVPTAPTAPQPSPMASVDHPDGTAGALGGIMPHQDMIAGHHINNLLQVTGNLTPPPGVDGSPISTQASIPGGATPPPGSSGLSVPQQPVSPDPSDPHHFVHALNGPFKTHGVIGDVLGHVMDAVLVGAGLKPEYGPRSQTAKQEDALLTGGAGSPQSLAAYGAVAGPEAAQKYQQDLLTQGKTVADANAAADKAKSDQIRAQATVEAEQNKALAASYGMAGTLAGETPGNATSEAKAKIIHNQIVALNKTRGLPTDDVPNDVAGLLLYSARGETPAALATSKSTQTYHAALIDEAKARTSVEQAGLGLRQQEVGLRAQEVGSTVAKNNTELADIKARTARDQAEAAAAPTAAWDKHQQAQFNLGHPTATRGGLIPTVKTVAEAQALKPGTKFKDPQGNIRVR